MLIISTIKPIPDTRDHALHRIVFLFPGMICAALLASSGVNIDLATITTSSINKDLNNTDTWQETSTVNQTIVLQNPVWIVVHVMIFLSLLIYVSQNILMLLTKHD